MGYDQERFAEEVIADLLCLICSEVLEDPVECSKCQTNFCKACIDDWSSRKSECPNRCELVLQAPHRFLKATLGQLKIKCNHEGCDKVVALEQLTHHEAKVCEFRVINCPNEDCDVKLPAMQFQSHQEECSFRLISCEKCSLQFKIASLPFHDCIKALSDMIRKLLRVNDEQQQRLDQLEISLNIRSRVSVNHSQFEHAVSCSVCRTKPILNVKYRCRLCPDFQVCERCSALPHEHNDFVAMTFSGEHSQIRCDSCKVLPISDLRYKCSVCSDFGKAYADLCQRCKLTTGHPHNLLEMLPIWAKVVPLSAERISYRDGQPFVRQWEVTNLGTQPVKNLWMMCVSGYPCCKP